MHINYGLLGKTLSHSRSKQLHKLYGNHLYEHYEVDPHMFRAVLNSRHFKGLNITIPYKIDAMVHCDELTPTARRIGSINTLYFEHDKLIGHNTDLDGFLYMCDRAGILLKDRKIIILGSGGTSLTAQVAAKVRGAKEIVIISRQGPKTYGDLSDFSDFDVLINTTPVGMFPNNGLSPVNLAIFKQLKGVVDVIYNPLKTSFLLDAEKRGIHCTGGLSMLMAQGYFSNTLFFGKPSSTSIEEALHTMERDMKNIVLVGMPGCGKTVLGRLISERLSRPFLDTDELIFDISGMRAQEILLKNGEEHFRSLETKAAQLAGKHTGAVIATGGGIVTRAENYNALVQNGFVVHIERALEKLDIIGRPLSQNTHMLETLHNKRLLLYRQFSDTWVNNDDSQENAAERIISLFNQRS